MTPWTARTWTRGVLEAEARAAAKALFYHAALLDEECGALRHRHVES
jgi:hypothetical protein